MQGAADVRCNQVISAFERGLIVDYHAPEYSNAKFLSEQGVSLIRKDTNWAFELVRDAAGPESDEIRPGAAAAAQQPSARVPAAG